MNNFKVIEVLDSTSLRVNPKWKLKMKNGTIISGYKIKVRELSGFSKNDMVFSRLKKLLLNNKTEIKFIAPELVSTENHNDAIVSCSVYIGMSNISYYFPEFVPKD